MILEVLSLPVKMVTFLPFLSIYSSEKIYYRLLKMNTDWNRTQQDGGTRMLNKVWAAMIAVSVFCALATGRMQQLSEAVLAGAGNAVQLIFGMMGMMCAWTGLMKIADAGGLTAILSRLLAPVLRRLFPAYPPESPAAKAICMNITANLWDWGNGI
ncbi:MAG: hypothetical protein ACLS8R_08605 [Anaeromassilibacillus sp.]